MPPWVSIDCSHLLIAEPFNLFLWVNSSSGMQGKVVQLGRSVLWSQVGR